MSIMDGIVGKLCDSEEEGVETASDVHHNVEAVKKVEIISYGQLITESPDDA